MASFVPPEGVEPPFGSGAPFQGPFATTSGSPSGASPSRYPSSYSSPSTLSPGSSPSTATDPSNPEYSATPGTASSSRNPASGAQLRNPLLAGFVVAAVLALSVIGFIFALRRHHRRQVKHLPAAPPPNPPGGSGGDRNSQTPDWRRDSWDVDPETAQAMMAAEAHAQYQRQLRDEGLNELGEAPPPYKQAASLRRARAPEGALPPSPPPSLALAPAAAAAAEGVELAALFPRGMGMERGTGMEGGMETERGTPPPPPPPPSSPVEGRFPDTVHHPRPPLLLPRLPEAAAVRSG